MISLDARNRLSQSIENIEIDSESDIPVLEYPLDGPLRKKFSPNAEGLRNGPEFTENDSRRT